jgi:hypothetical protein
MICLTGSLTLADAFVTRSGYACGFAQSSRPKSVSKSGAVPKRPIYGQALIDTDSKEWQRWRESPIAKDHYKNSGNYLPQAANRHGGVKFLWTKII